MTIPTELTRTHIGKVMALLEEMPRRLVALRTELTDEQYREPLVPGEWSLTQVLAHLIACADVRSQRIYFALLLNEPAVPDVHPQRDWERLRMYDGFTGMTCRSSLFIRKYCRMNFGMIWHKGFPKPDTWESRAANHSWYIPGVEIEYVQVSDKEQSCIFTTFIFG